MFRALDVDSSVLLLSCSISSGALGSPDVLLTSPINNNINAHNHHTHNTMPFCLSTSTNIPYNACRYRNFESKKFFARISHGFHRVVDHQESHLRR